MALAYQHLLQGAYHRQSTSLGHRQLLEATRSRPRGQAEAINALTTRIQALERSEQRLKARLAEQKDTLKDTKADLKAALFQASILEERLDEEEIAQRKLVQELDRYRRWWLNEFYSLKVAVQLIPDPDDGVLAMQESSRARYTFHLASLESSDSA